MDGSVVLVTGAASGIGNACVTRLLRDGALVVGFDRDAEGLEKCLGKAQPSLATLHGDIADRRDCAAAVDLCVERFGKISALIHCAGIHSSRFWTDLEAEELNRVLAVNVTGSFLIAKAAANRMVARQSGMIVLTSSTNVITGGVGGEAGIGGPAYVA
jgi:NAD(P)-dependent dehydrogenase (short-subunit alcohol dehydrogenase family)